LLLLRELQMRRAGADQNHGGAKRLEIHLAGSMIYAEEAAPESGTERRAAT
jgi:hypothetical protein